MPSCIESFGRLACCLLDSRSNGDLHDEKRRRGRQRQLVRGALVIRCWNAIKLQSVKKARSRALQAFLINYLGF